MQLSGLLLLTRQPNLRTPWKHGTVAFAADMILSQVGDSVGWLIGLEPTTTGITI